ncbi:hypothetical protein AAE478_006982 [Parahypoxylon ruwenzoriense]
MASSRETQSPQQKYGLSCPSGGTFYICQSSQIRFIGCCEANPCDSSSSPPGGDGGVCPQEALRPASYASYPGRHQTCVAPHDESSWYTCDGARPPFMGCCARNPCNDGCPAADLLPARLDDDDDIAAPFLSPSESSSTTSSNNSPSPMKSDTAAESSRDTQTPPRSTGLIVGLSMLGVVILLAVVGFMLWKRKRDEKPRRGGSHSAIPSRYDDSMPEMATSPQR